MRQKVTWRRTGHGPDRPSDDDDRVATGQSPASWLAANEAGWGVPHGLGGMLMALAWGYLAAEVARLIRAGRRRRRRSGGSPARRPR